MLTTNEVASFTGVTRNAVVWWIRTGSLPAQKMGRDYLIKKEDLTLAIQQKKILRGPGRRAKEPS